ncbi:MAG: hypothetical protein H9W81_02475 [Enterococcus sp.]|nr:hypothetical protein [Enterococcus sp.]
MATLHESLVPLSRLCDNDNRRRAYDVFEETLDHFDNAFILLYLLDMEEEKSANQSVFLISFYERHVGNWFQPGIDLMAALEFLEELSHQLDTDDKLQRLCMMVYEMDSTPLTLPDYREPDYAYLWEITGHTLKPSEESFFLYNDTIFETVPGPEYKKGMEFEAPQTDLLKQNEKDAAREFAKELSEEFVLHLIFSNLPDGIHKVSLSSPTTAVSLMLIKDGPNIEWPGNARVSLPSFVKILGDYIFRNVDFHFILRVSAVPDPKEFLLGKTGEELDKHDSSILVWRFEGKDVTPLNAQETIEFICTEPDGTISTPLQGFSYADAWVRPAP